MKNEKSLHPFVRYFVIRSFVLRMPAVPMRLLEVDDLFEPPGVPAALELRLQPDAHHAVDQLVAQKVGRQTEDIAVIVPTAHFGGDAVVAWRRADADHLVGGDAHAN